MMQPPLHVPMDQAFKLIFNGIPTKEAPFTMDELRDADEIIISSSGGLCIQAVELDGKPVG